MKCPICQHKFSWLDIALAPYPLWLKCKSCQAKLIGNKFVKLQAIVIPIVSLFFGISLAAYPAAWSMKVLIFLVGALIIVIPNIYLTMRFGQYNQIKSSRSQSDKS